MSNVLLAKSYNEDYSIIPQGIAQADDGNYIFVGRAFTSDLNSSAFATKITPGGTVLWSNTYSQPFTQFFSSLAKLNDGTFIATGSYFYSQYAGDEYLWIVRLDTTGNIIFQSALGIVGSQSDGISVCATKDGGYAVLSNLVEDGVTKTSVLKFSVNNDMIWQEFFHIGRGLSITETLDSGFVITGAHDMPDSLNSNVFILRLNSQGEKLWSEIYNDYEIYVLLNADIIENKVGHFIIAAKSLIMEVDSCGNILWYKQQGNFNFSLLAESPNDYVVGGAMIINNSDHAYIATLDKNGDFQKWNNTELLSPSEFTGLIINDTGLIVTCAYAPVSVNYTQAVITIFE